ncbi:MAG: alcohol dehydrogenase [Spirochaetes bacterium RBG_16_49_21]|nr:MAG: alcohol dehydrogenase [Spirochaetes bacterium RBG_16_49_21]
MRVAMYYNNRDVRIEEMPVPGIAPGEILVKVLSSGICGSDVMEWYRLKKAPLVLGHEITGEIVKTGEKVHNYHTGQRVFVSHHVPCNTCRHCLNGNHTACETLHTTNFDPGGFAEYVRVPELNVDRGVFLLPEEVSFDQGTLIEPLACVIRGQGIARLRPGQSVLVLGSGMSGLLHIALARSLGAGRIIATDISEYRLSAAKKFGADAVIYARENVPKAVLELNGGRPADLAVVCTGVLSAFEQALESVDRGGTVLFFAPTDPGVNLSVPINALWRNGTTLLPSYGGSPADIAVAIELLAAGRVIVDEMITHRLSLDQAAIGFRMVAEASESIKVILKPHQE